MKTLLFLLLTLPLLGADYYVATTGNDTTGDGSSGTPWATINKALSIAVAGDTIHVASGDYTGPRVQTVNSGSSGSPITLIGEGATQPIVSSIEVLAEDWIVIDNFEFNGHASVASMCYIALNSTDIIVRNCTFDPVVAGRSSLACQASSPLGDPTPTRVTISNCDFLNTNYYNVALQGSYHVLENCYFGTPASGAWSGDAIYLHSSNTTISGNVFEDYNIPQAGQHTDLIQAFSNNGEISRDNLIIGNLAKDCVGCQIGNWTDDGDAGRITRWTFINNIYDNVEAQVSITCDDFKFYNNVFNLCGQNGNGPLLFRQNGTGAGNCDSATLKNNIFLNCGNDPTNPSVGYYGVIGTPTIDADYNLIVGTGAGQTKNFISDPNSINGQDPLFTNVAGDVWTLQAGSPAIGAGVDLSGTFTTDFTGNTRGTPWDMGSYAYTVGVQRGNVVTGTITVGP